MTYESPSQQKPKLVTTGAKSTKQCTKCNLTLSVDKFHPTKNTCKKCGSIARANLHNKQTDAEYLWTSARNRAKRNNRAFSITVADVEAVMTDVCCILNMPIKRYLITPNNTSPTKFAIKDDSKTLDRIDPTKGYEPGNIRVISWRANSLLKDMTLEELKAISNYYHSLTNGC